MSAPKMYWPLPIEIDLYQVKIDLCQVNLFLAFDSSSWIPIKYNKIITCVCPAGNWVLKSVLANFEGMEAQHNSMERKQKAQAQQIVFVQSSRDASRRFWENQGISFKRSSNFMGWKKEITSRIMEALPLKLTAVPWKSMLGRSSLEELDGHFSPNAKKTYFTQSRWRSVDVKPGQILFLFIFLFKVMIPWFVMFKIVMFTRISVGCSSHDDFAHLLMVIPPVFDSHRFGSFLNGSEGHDIHRFAPIFQHF